VTLTYWCRFDLVQTEILGRCPICGRRAVPRTQIPGADLVLPSVFLRPINESAEVGDDIVDISLRHRGNVQHTSHAPKGAPKPKKSDPSPLKVEIIPPPNRHAAKSKSAVMKQREERLAQGPLTIDEVAALQPTQEERPSAPDIRAQRAERIRQSHHLNDSNSWVPSTPRSEGR
jgi:hypothetical protein